MLCARVFTVGVDAKCGSPAVGVDYNVRQGRFICLLEQLPAFPHKLYSAEPKQSLSKDVMRQGEFRVGASIVRVCTSVLAQCGHERLEWAKLQSAKECQLCRHITAIRVLFPGMGCAGVRACMCICTSVH